MLTLAALLASCGFALRGQAQLPQAMAQTAIAAPAGSQALVNELTALLRGNGISVVDEAPEAATLKINVNQIQREVQSVGATARVREFALRYTVQFELLHGDGRTVLMPQSLVMERDYTFDQGEVLGAASEEEYLREELTRDMARRILETIELAGR